MIGALSLVTLSSLILGEVNINNLSMGSEL